MTDEQRAELRRKYRLPTEAKRRPLDTPALTLADIDARIEAAVAAERERAQDLLAALIAKLQDTVADEIEKMRRSVSLEQREQHAAMVDRIQEINTMFLETNEKLAQTNERLAQERTALHGLGISLASRPRPS